MTNLPRTFSLALTLSLFVTACSGEETSGALVNGGNSTAPAGGSAVGGNTQVNGPAAVGGQSSTVTVGFPQTYGGSGSVGNTQATGAAIGGGKSSTGTGGVTQASGGSGSVGTSSTGGVPSKGGTSSTGGVQSKGGTSSTGGVPSKGGTTSSGGVQSKGGTTSSGGVQSKGGATSSGGTSAAGGATVNSSSAGAVNAATLAKAMGFGANIGNTLENTASWETGWGQPLITKAFIDGMASRGIKSVRVPVAWDTYANNGVIDATKMNRVKEVVGWIEAAGMYSIVNIHWDGGWIFNENKANAYKLTEDVKTKFASYWKQIATAFSGVGHQLILEGLNEEARYFVNGDPNGTPDIAPLNTINQLFVTTVRAQGGFNATRALLIAGFQTDIAKTCVNSFTVPSDPAGAGKLLLSIHYYDPYTFTLMEDAASWGSPTGTWGTTAEKNTLQTHFNTLGTFSTNKKIPVVIGEFTVTKGTKVVRQSASRILWIQSVAEAAMSRGMAPVLWDTGSDINRSNGSLSTELQTVLNNLK